MPDTFKLSIFQAAVENQLWLLVFGTEGFNADFKDLANSEHCEHASQDFPGVSAEIITEKVSVFLFFHVEGGGELELLPTAGHTWSSLPTKWLTWHLLISSLFPVFFTTGYSLCFEVEYQKEWGVWSYFKLCLHCYKISGFNLSHHLHE